MCQPKLDLRQDASTTDIPFILPETSSETPTAPSPVISYDETQIDWNPYESRLTLNFGTVGPSAGPWPWVLERKNAWDFDHWVSPSGEGEGHHLLQQARIIRLVLSEEFLFDTIDPTDKGTFGAYISAAHAYWSLTPWGEILATLRSSLQYLRRTQVDMFEIHVRGLHSLSSMSDHGIGEEQDSTAVLRPTASVYTEFIEEFTRCRWPTERIRLSGLFPGDWEGLIETRMAGSKVIKDFSEFVKEICWWTVDTSNREELEGLSESELRRRHAEARWAMLNGAGSDHDECDSDPGYETDGCSHT